MSFLTDINLGLRYILSIAPYVLHRRGKGRSLGGWAVPDGGGWIGVSIVACGRGADGRVLALWIHPHYLAYFNWASGGPDRVPPRLIDSNLDWGQDLVGLRDWCVEYIPGQPIGLAYFGQINPSIFGLSKSSEKLDWFLPPVEPGSTAEIPLKPGVPPRRLVPPAKRLFPGYYAVSATLVYGLPWRLYDPSPETWAPVWNAGEHAFSYFQEFEPIARIGHSIYVYKLTQQDVDRVALLLESRG